MLLLLNFLLFKKYCLDLYNNLIISYKKLIFNFFHFWQAIVHPLFLQGIFIFLHGNKNPIFLL